jgi:hypothetical protein
VLRFEVSEEGREALPPVDLDDASVMVGSAADARVRLPAAVADAEHVLLERGRWRARARLLSRSVRTAYAWSRRRPVRSRCRRSEPRASRAS